jgi:hypothetical protein
MCLLSLVLLALFLVAVAAGARGLAGLLATRGRGRRGRTSVALVVASSLGLLGLSVGVWWALVKTHGLAYRVSDERIRPYLSALAAVDRGSLGFTPIPEDAKILVLPADGERGYDVLLRVHPLGSRSIYFRENANGSYEWVGESQAFTGPHRYDSGAGIRNEEVVIGYYTVPISGAPLNQVQYYYRGDDPRLRYKPFPTLEEVRPVLEEWRKLPATPAP